MHRNTPHWLFDPSSPGWIHRRLEADQYVSADDLRRVLRAHPESREDPVILRHSLRLVTGEAKAPRGRPSAGLERASRIWMLGELVHEQVAEWKKGIGDDVPPRGRGELSLSEAAWEKYARPLGMTGRGLQNACGALKRHPLLGE